MSELDFIICHYLLTCSVPAYKYSSFRILDLYPCKEELYYLHSLVAQMVKRLSMMWQTWVQSLSWEGNGNPLQYYCLENCLENPMDRGAWQAKVHRVAKSQT